MDGQWVSWNENLSRRKPVRYVSSPRETKTQCGGEAAEELVGPREQPFKCCPSKIGREPALVPCRRYGERKGKRKRLGRGNSEAKKGHEP